jgi:hypothetical protein
MEKRQVLLASRCLQARFGEVVIRFLQRAEKNRLVDGHGVKGSTETHEARGKALRDEGHGPLLCMLDAAAPSPVQDARTQPGAEGCGERDAQ